MVDAGLPGTLESIKALAQRPAMPPPPAPASLTAAEQLERLAALRDRGVLTEHEFAQQKAAVLAAATK